MATMMGLAMLKAVVVLSLVLFFGQRLMSKWFFIVARGKSAELFMLNVLLITLGLAYLTEVAGLSLALGAFVAGILISETQYRHHVEEDIKPFRDVLMGLFFVTIGMMLDIPLVLTNAPLVLGVLGALLVTKFALVLGLSRLFGSTFGGAMRTGLWLCAGGEFGFVLLSEMRHLQLLPPMVLQAVLAALVLSMLLAPLIVQYSNQIVLRFAASEWLMRSMQMTQLAAKSMNTEKHVVICGYGRTGQYLARFMEEEDVTYLALDLDPERIREATAAGENVIYGDAARHETLIAAGVSRASVLIISFADARVSERVLEHARQINPKLADHRAHARRKGSRRAAARRRRRGRPGNAGNEHGARRARPAPSGCAQCASPRTLPPDAQRTLQDAARLLSRRERSRRRGTRQRRSAPAFGSARRRRACRRTHAWRAELAGTRR
jgi:CPA2 family monovalent cation:H+ antiporter-2